MAMSSVYAITSLFAVVGVALRSTTGDPLQFREPLRHLRPLPAQFVDGPFQLDHTQGQLSLVAVLPDGHPRYSIGKLV